MCVCKGGRGWPDKQEVVWPVLHGGVTPFKWDKAEHFRFEPVALGTQSLGVLWAACCLRYSWKEGTCGGGGRGFTLRIELPSVCTDPRRQATALEVGVVSGQVLEPTRVVVGAGVWGWGVTAVHMMGGGKALHYSTTGNGDGHKEQLQTVCSSGRLHRWQSEWLISEFWAFSTSLSPGHTTLTADMSQEFLVLIK